MREIKFKFWDSKNRIMYLSETPDYVVCSDGEVGKLIYDDSDIKDYIEFEGTYYSRHIRPLQYIGRDDKDETEIYEDDLVVNSSGRIMRVSWFESPSYCGWDLIAVNSVGVPPRRYNFWEDLKVIGNIHQGIFSGDE